MHFQQIIYDLQVCRIHPNYTHLLKEGEESAGGVKPTHWIKVVFANEAKQGGAHFKEYFEVTEIQEITEIHYFDAQNVFVLAIGNYMQDWFSKWHHTANANLSHNWTIIL